MALAAEVTRLDDGTGAYTLLDDNGANLTGIIKLVHNNSLTVVYENAGYATNNFGAPDFNYDELVQTFDVPATLPSDMNDTFTFYVKRKDGLNVVTLETKESKRGASMTGALEATYNCNDGTLTVEDITVYPAGASSISLSMLIVYPPNTVSNQTIASAILNTTYTPSYLYTGVYVFTLSGTFSVVDSTPGNIPTITFYTFSAELTTTVACSTDLCAAACLVSSAWTNWQNAILANKDVQFYWNLFAQAQATLGLGFIQSQYCGKDFTPYHNAIVALLGDCDCGCDEELSSGTLIKKCC